MKYYKISENILYNLLLDSNYLAALKYGGVSDWPWYSEAIRTYIESYPEVLQKWVDTCSSVEIDEEVSIYDMDKSTIMEMITEKQLEQFKIVKETKK